MWEPLHFMRMRGGQPDNYAPLYNYQRSRDYLTRLAEEGGCWVKLPL
jgi:hypothetical protein